MSLPNVRVRVKIGVNEAEIEAPINEVKGIVELLPNIISSLPLAERPSEIVPQKDLPELKVDKKDSLTDIILKLFNTPWGKQARKLSDVKSVLDSYGLIYPKQSVAVALLRLAQSGKLRRFKGEEGEYVYTSGVG